MALKLSDNKIILLLMLLQLAVCLPFINSFPIALDEPFSIYWAQQDLDVMLAEINKGNNSPLHFILLHYWIKFFGISAYSVRSLSMIFGIVSIFPFYKLSRLFLSNVYSSIAVILLISSSLMHFHFIEARMYSLLLCLVLFLLLYSYKFIFTDEKNWWIISLLNILILYTHFLGIIVYLIQFTTYLVLFKEIKGKKLKLLFLSWITTLILVIPGTIQLMSRMNNGTGENWLETPNLKEIIDTFLKFFNNPFGFVSILLGISSILIFSHLKNKNNLASKHAMYYLLTWSFGGFFMILIFTFSIQPIFLDRYLLFLIPPFLLLITYLFQELNPFSKYNLSLIFLIPFFIAFKVYPDNQRNPDEVAVYINSIDNKNSKIFVYPPSYMLTFLYHYDVELFKNYNEVNYQSDKFFSDYDLNRVLKYNNFDSLIILDSDNGFLYNDNSIKQEASNWGDLIFQKEFNENCTVYLYVN